MLRTLGGLQERSQQTRWRQKIFGLDICIKYFIASNYTIALFFILTFIVSKMMGKIKHFMSYKTFVVKFG